MLRPAAIARVTEADLDRLRARTAVVPGALLVVAAGAPPAADVPARLSEVLGGTRELPATVPAP